jgi:hypothetical protein
MTVLVSLNSLEESIESRKVRTSPEFLSLKQITLIRRGSHGNIHIDKNGSKFTGNEKP